MTDGLLSNAPLDVSIGITKKRETDVISQDVRTAEIRQQAAEWAVQLTAAPLNGEQELALEAWRHADVAHEQALDFALRTWAELGQLAAAAPVIAPASQPITSAKSPRHNRRRRPLRRLASAAVLLLLVGMGVQQMPSMLVPMLADFATSKGQVQRFQLPDGSSAVLNTQSAITVAYTDSERRIRLLQGEGEFDVAPMGANETRPFVVESEGGTTRALGTRFVVGHEGGGSWVGVLEHSVAVALEQPPQTGARELVVQEGQGVHYDGRRGVSPLPNLNVQRAAGWQRGVLVFEREPLGQVVEQLNRYRAGRVMITDQALASREVSGVFRLDDLDQALAMLANELQVKRKDLAGFTLLY